MIYIALDAPTQNRLVETCIVIISTVATEYIFVTFCA